MSRWSIFSQKRNKANKLKEASERKVIMLYHSYFIHILAFLSKKTDEKFVKSEKSINFATAFREMFLAKGYAAIAQLVERDLAKVEVAGPSPVCRSTF